MGTACLFQGTDFLLHLIIETVLHITDIDHHIDFITAILQCLLHLGYLGLCHTVAQREAHYGTDIDFLPIGLMYSLNIAGRNADTCRMVSDCLLTKLFYILPGGKCLQLGMIHLL